LVICEEYKERLKKKELKYRIVQPGFQINPDCVCVFEREREREREREERKF
jgi:hypothetical protein